MGAGACRPLLIQRTDDPSLQDRLGEIASLSDAGPSDWVDTCDLEVIYRTAGVSEGSPAREHLKYERIYTAEEFLTSLEDLGRATALAPQLFYEREEVERRIGPLVWRQPLVLGPVSSEIAFLPLPVFTEKNSKQTIESIKDKAWAQPFECVFPKVSLYRDLPAYGLLIRYVQEFIYRAKQDLQEKTGLSFPPGGDYRLFFVDRRGSVDDKGTQADYEAETGATGINGARKEYTVFYLDNLVFKVRVPADGTVQNLDEALGEAGQKIRHELVHILMRQSFGVSYGMLPKWIKEGVAVFLAGQGGNKLDQVLDSAAQQYEFYYIAEGNEALDRTKLQPGYDTTGMDTMIRHKDQFLQKARDILSLKGESYATNFLKFDFLIRRIAIQQGVSEGEAVRLFLGHLKGEFDRYGRGRRHWHLSGWVSPDEVNLLVTGAVEEETGLEMSLFETLGDWDSRFSVREHADSASFKPYLQALRAKCFFEHEEQLAALRQVQRESPPYAFLAGRARWHEALALRVPDPLTSLAHYLSLGDEGTLADFGRIHRLILMSQIGLLLEFGFNEEVLERGARLVTLFPPHGPADYYRTYLSMAIAAFRMGRREEAARHLAQATSMMPKNQLDATARQYDWLKAELQGERGRR